MALKCARNHRNWLTCFEDVSRKCEPSDVVTSIFNGDGMGLLWERIRMIGVKTECLIIEVEAE